MLSEALKGTLGGKLMGDKKGHTSVRSGKK